MTTVKGYMGSVSFDGEFVTISKAMRGDTTISVSSINAISIEPAGLGMKGIRFAVGGGSDSRKKVKVGGSHKKVAEDPYGLTFRSGRKDEFEAFANEVRRAQAASQ